jgi:hypothetical protein
VTRRRNPAEIRRRIDCCESTVAHRRLKRQGFVNGDKQWWRFTYQPEPYPDNVFDFPVDPLTLAASMRHTR